MAFHCIGPFGRFGLKSAISVSCVCVCHRGNPASQCSELAIFCRRAYPLDGFRFLLFQKKMCFKFVCVFGSLQTSLLCIIGELAVGGPVAVAVGIRDRWQVSGDRWHAPPEICQIIFVFFLFLSITVHHCYYRCTSRDSVQRWAVTLVRVSIKRNP